MNSQYAPLITVLQGLTAELMESDDIGDYAIELAIAGWRVFPLRGKSPAASNPHARGSAERLSCKGECGCDGHGVHDATADLARVAAWWSGKYRGANIGARVPANVFVLDIDPRNGGLDSIARLTASYGDLPSTLETASGRGDGGTHRYFRAPIGKLTNKHLGNGIDIKTSAGYVVVPPSIHPDSGKPYCWTKREPIADPPVWLVDLIRPPVVMQAVRTTRFSGGTITGSSPSVADAFCDAFTWAHILEPAGWTCIDPNGDADGARWLHPAATSDCSATIRHGCLFVYSDNTIFDPTTASDPHGYTKFRAHALLNFGGNMSTAARSLLETGTA